MSLEDREGMLRLTEKLASLAEQTGIQETALMRLFEEFLALAQVTLAKPKTVESSEPAPQQKETTRLRQKENPSKDWETLTTENFFYEVFFKQFVALHTQAFEQNDLPNSVNISIIIGMSIHNLDGQIQTSQKMPPQWLGMYRKIQQGDIPRNHLFFPLLTRCYNDGQSPYRIIRNNWLVTVEAAENEENMMICIMGDTRVRSDNRGASIGLFMEVPELVGREFVRRLTGAKEEAVALLACLLFGSQDQSKPSLDIGYRRRREDFLSETQKFVLKAPENILESIEDRSYRQNVKLNDL